MSTDTAPRSATGREAETFANAYAEALRPLDKPALHDQYRLAVRARGPLSDTMLRVVGQELHVRLRMGALGRTEADRAAARAEVLAEYAVRTAEQEAGAALYDPSPKAAA